ncbi:MAG TPA: hypothetical protein VIZ18_13840 [Ktedonobacteraceae bacterium]
MKNQKSILSPQERRQRNREEMKNAILEAARQVMREEGVAALNPARGGSPGWCARALSV